MVVTAVRMVVTASVLSTAALYTPLHILTDPYTPHTPPRSGTFECFVKKLDDGLEDPRGRLVLSYAQGSTFGELALMYNAPRAASVVATSDASLWAMERETFSNIVMQTMSQKRAHLQGLLGAVPLLQGLDTYERHALADLFEEKTFKAGEGRVGVSVGVGVGIRVVRVTG